MLEIKEFIDKATGNKFNAIGKKGQNTTHFYYTNMVWYNDSRHILVCTGVKKTDNFCSYKLSCNYVLVDTQTGENTVVAENVPSQCALVASDNWIYYYLDNELIGVKPVTFEKKLIAKSPEGTTFDGQLSITNDAKIISFCIKKGETYTVSAIDVETGKINEIVTPNFEPPLNIVSHPMINPEHKNTIFYAHEGATHLISDRIWTADCETGEAVNLYKQSVDSDGRLMEYLGHEMWAKDGERLYFVRYIASPAKPAGVYFVSRDGKESGFVNGDYYYWHVAASPDGRLLAADTFEADELNTIAVIDIETKESRLICNTKRWIYHPGHPHPSFSPNGRMLNFTFADEDDELWVGYYKLD